MLKKALYISVTLSLCLLSACAKENLDAPCADFGRNCYQAPINNWDINK